jgi:antitoxin component of MazEF toxin-antitoxin module
MKPHVEKHGDKLVATIPDELIQAVAWDHGDVLQMQVDGEAIIVTRAQTAHDHALEIAREIMDEYRSVFEALAKT